MPCECCQIKKPRRNGFFEPRKNCCKVCRRILCHSCATQKVCRFCTLKETTILEKEKLMKLTEEELIELAEAFEVSIDAGKLMKWELVQLILITCKNPNSLKSPPGTPKSSPGTPNSPPGTPKSPHETPKLPPRNLLLMTKDDDIPLPYEKISPTHFELSEHSFEKQRKREQQSTFVRRNLSLLPDTNEKPKGNYLSTEKQEDTLVVKSVISSPEDHQVIIPSMQDSRVTLEKTGVVRYFVNPKVDEVDTLYSINHNSTKQVTKANRKLSKRREEIKKLSSKDVIPTCILREEQIELMGKIDKHGLVEHESKTTESDCSSISPTHSSKDIQEILSKKNLQEQKIVSLSDITSSDAINELSIHQLEQILRDHSTDLSGLLEKWELAYRVLQLWHDLKNKEGNKPEVIFENVSLRVSAICSPVNEFKTNYIKAKKRRGLYVTRHSDIEETVPEQSLWQNTPHCESEEEDCISSKKKKLEDENLQKKSKTNLKLDVQAALLPPMRQLSIDDVISPDNIKGLSSPELLGILRNHPRNVTSLHEGDENNRWKLAFKVLELWNTEHSLKMQEQLEECKICMESTANCTLLDCGHVATCFQCGKNLQLCPICRQDVVRVVQLYKA